MEKKDNKPPVIAEKLLFLFLPDEIKNTAPGDFEEEYIDIAEECGRLKAGFWYWIQVIKSAFLYICNSYYGSFSMFGSYIKIAFRNNLKHKAYTFINIFGLALGITCFIFLMMYVKYELNYDSFHEKSGRIFRINQHWEAWNYRGSSDFASTNGAMNAILTVEFPEIEYAIRVQEVSSSLKYGQITMVENGIYADRDFFNTFTYPLISGDPNTALENPSSIVISRELSEKLFGTEDPVGKALLGLRGLKLTVTGVCEKAPSNSHLQFDFIISFKTMYSLRNDIDTSWGILNYYNYILLKENIQYKEFEKKLTLLVDKYHDPEETVRYYFLQPVTDIHLDSFINSSITNTGDRKYIYLFTTVAFLILFIACINYVNLATSRASLRGKEVGIRKTIGARRSELMKQFLGESIILTVSALLVSLLTVYLIHPYYRNFTGLDIPLTLLLNPVSITGLFTLIIMVGLVSGFYPSFLLSSFKPANVLKAGSKSNSIQNRFKIRNILVVFQFLISIILIVATIVINKQLSFIMNKDIGFNRENIITIRLWDSNNVGKHDVIKKELVKYNNITGAAVSDRAPLRASQNNSIRVQGEKSDEMVSLPQVSHFYVDYDFLGLYKIKIKEGRNFSPDFGTDMQEGAIVNESLVNLLGLKNPIGKRISASNLRDAKIIGVVKDFHYASFTNKIGPIVFVYRPMWAAKVLSLKISAGIGDISGTLDYAKSTIHNHIPEFAFNYQFLENRFNMMYDSENKMGTVFSVFSMITLLIASFGLLGLISFITAQKTKEIGIRKILGASVTKITGLVVKEFMILVIISSLIALPASYFMMNNWLDNFAYRTNITVWTMLVSSMIAFMFAIISVIYQVLKAATAKPVNALRHE